MADRDRGLFLGGVHLAARFRGYLGDDLETFGIEYVVSPEILLGRLLQRDDAYFFEHQAIRGEAFADVILDFASEAVAVLVQLLERLGRGETAQCADDFCFEQVTDFLGVEGLFSERAAGG
ncbi:MAG: hypothetical protein ABSE67_01895 [Xanthobacteraceae bacterium]